MFTRYKGTGIPENYSGVRFREQAAHTEMKTHKPSPSYTSTRTSVSPMFRRAQLQRNQGGATKDENISTFQNDMHRENTERGAWEENEMISFEQGNERQSAYENQHLDGEARDLGNQGWENGRNFSSQERESTHDLGGHHGLGAQGYENGRDSSSRERENTYGLDSRERESAHSFSGQEREPSREGELENKEIDSKKAHKGADFKAELSGLLDKIFKGIQGEDFLLLAVIFLILGGENSESKGALLPLALLLLYS